MCRLEQEKVETKGMAWTVVRGGAPISAGIPCGKRAGLTALPYGPKEEARAKGWCWGGSVAPSLRGSTACDYHGKSGGDVQKQAGTQWVLQKGFRNQMGV